MMALDVAGQAAKSASPLIFPCAPAVNSLESNIPICHASPFNDCKLRKQGTNLCSQYNAQHLLTILFLVCQSIRRDDFLQVALKSYRHPGSFAAMLESSIV